MSSEVPIISAGMVETVIDNRVLRPWYEKKKEELSSLSRAEKIARVAQLIYEEFVTYSGDQLESKEFRLKIAEKLVDLDK